MKLVQKKIRTLIVDDSITIRKVIAHLLLQDPRFEVAGEAAHPDEALKLINSKQFDLITMDLHLPKMTGADLIKEYMKSKPIPTVVISSLRPEESNLVLESLENGAVDYLQKMDQKTFMALKSEILERLFEASQAKINKSSAIVKSKASPFGDFQGLFLIGASTGGTEAIREVLSQMGSEIPPTLVVQHIPPFFSEAFAQRLNKLFPFEVKEAKHGDALMKNRVLIAPGGLQMKLVKKGPGYVVELEDSAPVNRHKPSVDYMFDSVVKTFSGQKIAMILTGMGADGAAGLLNLKNAGTFTIAQDEKTCVVFGMPREAIKRGAALEICGLNQMGEAVQKGLLYFSRRHKIAK